MSATHTTTAEDAQRNLARYVEAAERGETTVVTRGDRPVARISPPTAEIVPEAPGDVDRAQRLRRAHALIRRAAEVRAAVDLGGDSVVTLIREGRERGGAERDRRGNTPGADGLVRCRDGCGDPR